jgi:hypothetical protein
VEPSENCWIHQEKRRIHVESCTGILRFMALFLAVAEETPYLCDDFFPTPYFTSE